MHQIIKQAIDGRIQAMKQIKALEQQKKNLDRGIKAMEEHIASLDGYFEGDEYYSNFITLISCPINTFLGGVLANIKDQLEPKLGNHVQKEGEPPHLLTVIKREIEKMQLHTAKIEKLTGNDVYQLNELLMKIKPLLENDSANQGYFSFIFMRLNLEMVDTQLEMSDEVARDNMFRGMRTGSHMSPPGGPAGPLFQGLNSGFFAPGAGPLFTARGYSSDYQLMGRPGDFLRPCDNQGAFKNGFEGE